MVKEVLPVPRWTVWFSFCLYFIYVIFFVVVLLFVLSQLSVNPSGTIARIIGLVIAGYFVFYVPAKVLWHVLKQKER